MRLDSIIAHFTYNIPKGKTKCELREKRKKDEEPIVLGQGICKIYSFKEGDVEETIGRDLLKQALKEENKFTKAEKDTINKIIFPKDEFNKGKGRRFSLKKALDETDFNKVQRTAIWVSYFTQASDGIEPPEENAPMLVAQAIA